MLVKSKLITVGNFDFRLNHLLIIGILILSFTISFLLRSQAIDYGFELNEFDPFFNYRATQYIVDNGIDAYLNWNDDLSWYPLGRDVSATSQVMLHLTTATLYWIFGGELNLYDFTIIFPVIFGSLSSIVLFALVRVIGGTTAGLFSALLYSVSLPILIRGPIGWFKSEPLGLFFSFLALYFLLSGLNTQNKKISFAKIIGAGIFIVFSISSWGGNQFFIIPIGIFFLVLPFLRSDHKDLIWKIPLFTILVTIVSLSFERLYSNFIFGIGGFALFISTIFLVGCIIIQYKSKKIHKTRNGLLFFIVIIILGTGVVILSIDSQYISMPFYRYLNAINPFLTTNNPLVDSISEHATTTIQQSFVFHSILMIFSGIGIWLMLRGFSTRDSSFIKNDMLSFSLILGIAGVYVSSTFVRLEVFASVAIIILASLGLTILTKEFFKTKLELKLSNDKFIRVSYVVGVIVLLIVSITYPLDSNIFVASKVPPTILNGGTTFNVSTSDWLDSLEWIKNNTPQDAVIAAWWDYGYWISTMGERPTLADNSTIHTEIIENIAKMFLSTPDDAWISLHEMKADYVLVFVAGQKLGIDSDESFYVLQGGGDESKKQWFMRIAGEDLSKYLFYDGISGTEYFWNNTMLAQMFPFTPITYINFQTNQQSAIYQPGLEPVYVKDIKYPSNGDGPLRLVYASPSFTEDRIGPMLGIFIYEINKDYKPNS